MVFSIAFSVHFVWLDFGLFLWTTFIYIKHLFLSWITHRVFFSPSIYTATSRIIVTLFVCHQYKFKKKNAFWIDEFNPSKLLVWWFFFCSPFYSTWNWVDSWNWNAEIHNNIEYGQFCWKSILNWVIINVNKFDTFRFNQMSIFRSYQINRINLRSVSLSVGIHIVKVAFQSINRFIHTHSGTDAFSTNKIHYIKF